MNTFWVFFLNFLSAYNIHPQRINSHDFPCVTIQKVSQNIFFMNLPFQLFDKWPDHYLFFIILPMLISNNYSFYNLKSEKYQLISFRVLSLNPIPSSALPFRCSFYPGRSTWQPKEPRVLPVRKLRDKYASCRWPSKGIVSTTDCTDKHRLKFGFVL